MTTGVIGTVVVVGSANMDIVLSVDRAPAQGETVIATGTAHYPGGKGLNQLVASARAGVPTVFIGALGRDAHGDALAGVLADDGVDTALVRRVGTPTGQAYIVVDGRGDNSIIVASGANTTVVALTGADRAAVSAASVLLLQLEIPIDTVIAAARTARAAGVAVMLNAAPARSLPAQLVGSLDYLIVNEFEACLIGGSDDLATASTTLAHRVPHLVVTMGAQGSVLYEAGVEVARITAPQVTAVDTTGAGDTFCGAFAAAIAEGSDIVAAARFATAAAALSVQALGAVPSIPVRARIDSLLAGLP